MKKLRNNRGETLIEVLASILIGSLSVALLFGCVMASSGMDRDAERLDEAHYEALADAERQTETANSGTINIVNQSDSTQSTLDINIYGGAGMYSYKRTEP